MLNLVSIAMKFTIEGFVKVAKTWIEETVRFEVQDSRVGIKQESLPNLFKMFGKQIENQDINKTGCGIDLHVS